MGRISRQSENSPMYTPKLLPIKAVSTLLLITILYTPSLSGSDPVRIVPIGDSITQGRGWGVPTYSYRYPLWKMLIDAGVDLDFVGSLNGGFESNPSWPAYNDIPFDLDHEGHWGWRTDSIRDSLANWLGGYTPDIALILLGTNDAGPDNTEGLSHAQSADRTKEEIRDIIDLLRADNPNVIILLGDPFQEWAPFPLYRTAFGALATEESSEASPVINVAHDPGWISDPGRNGTHTVDWVHPNQAGDLHLATRWYEALFPWLAVNWTAWQEWYFPLETHLPIASQSFDADGDGLSNLVEYAIGSDPISPDSALYGPQIVIENQTLHYTFARDTRLTSIRSRVEMSSDLLTWETVFNSDDTTENNNGNHHTVSLDVSEPGSCFVRLVIKEK